MYVAISLGLTLLAGAFAVQGQTPRVSPRGTVKAVVNGIPVLIEYGRPSLKGRKLNTLARPGKIWRTGADEAPTLACLGDITLGPLLVPAGNYSLFTIPGEDEWTLIVNRVARQQWGDSEYDKKKDLGRISMKVARLATPVEQFTIVIEPDREGGILKISWGDVEASVLLKAP
ncbi:MAG TPA: DUF2911 domain-containing protein [Paludibaculum sp.]|jgi:hypothetical protein